MVAAPVSFVGLILIALVAMVLIAVPVGIVVAIAYASRRNIDQGSNPNLAPCPDCQKLISIHAPTCPHCGRPIKTA